MRLIGIIFFIVIFLGNLAHAADECGASAPFTCSTWANLKACVEAPHTSCTAFQDGDIINLDTSATASASITISDPMTISGGGYCNDRNTTVDGCGEVAQPGGSWPVVITGGGSSTPAFVITGGNANDKIVITGFSFTGTFPNVPRANNGGAISINYTNLSSKWEIHNCQWSGHTGVAITANRPNWGGLIYKCYIAEYSGIRLHELSETSATSGGYTATLLVDADPNWGGSNFTFIEDCTFYSATVNVGATIIDSSESVKLVIRYNYFFNTWVSSHGATDGTVHPSLAWEVYNNVFTGDDSLNWAISLRSGTVLAHTNSTDATYFISGFAQLGDESGRDESSWGVQDNANAWDGDADSPDGYPYFGQFGWPTTSGATWNIAGNTSTQQPLTLRPAYIWNNSGRTNITESSPYLALNTEYYSGSAPDGYTAYTYPHPLRGETTVTGTHRGMSMGGGKLQ